MDHSVEEMDATLNDKASMRNETVERADSLGKQLAASVCLKTRLSRN